MAHGYPDYQPIVTPTPPLLGEGQEVWYQSEIVLVDGLSYEDLISYVVPDDYELHICSGMVSCAFPCTQRYDLRQTPAGDWVHPVSSIDPDSKWSDEEKAYDSLLTTGAKVTSGGHYLEFYPSSPITCSKIRLYAASYAVADGLFYDPEMDIDVYYEGDWHNIFSGTVTKNTWVEKSFTEKAVSKARVKWNYEVGFLDGLYIYEFEFDMTSTTAQECIYFDTYAIIPFIPEAPYPVPTGATFQLRAYNDDVDAHYMTVNLAGFLQKKTT